MTEVENSDSNQEGSLENPSGEGQSPAEVAIENILYELTTLRLEGQEAVARSEEPGPNSSQLKSFGETLLAKTNSMVEDIQSLLTLINETGVPPKPQS